MRGVENKAYIFGLYQRHSKTLKAFLTQKLPTSQDAEDVMQDTFVRLMARSGEGVASIESMASPESYMYRTAANLAIDKLRQQKVRTAQSLDAELEETIECQLPSPLRQVELTQRMVRLEACVHRLPPKCREAFILNKYHQLTYREVAQQMGISVSMVEKHLIKALERIDNDLGEE